MSHKKTLFALSNCVKKDTQHFNLNHETSFEKLTNIPYFILLTCNFLVPFKGLENGTLAINRLRLGIPLILSAKADAKQTN